MLFGCLSTHQIGVRLSLKEMPARSSKPLGAYTFSAVGGLNTERKLQVSFHCSGLTQHSLSRMVDF